MKDWEQHLFELQIKRDKLDIHDIRGLFQLDEEIGLVQQFVDDLKEILQRLSEAEEREKWVKEELNCLSLMLDGSKKESVEILINKLTVNK